MVGIDLKAVPRLGAFGQALEQLVRCLENVSAFLADKMTVSARCQVIGRRSMAKVGMDDHPHPLQILQIAIDRREVDIGRLRLHRFGEFLRRPVARLVEKDMKEQSPRTGDAPSLLFECCQDVIDRLELHQ